MRPVMSSLLLLVTLISAGSVAYAQRPAQPPDGNSVRRVLRVAVVITPDVVLQGLITAFEQQARYSISLQITEGVYELARTGQADLVIAHYGHPGTETFVSEGLGRWPRMVFSNQAALVGPSSDPAGIRGMTDAAEALRLIAARGGEFIVNNAVTERYLGEVLWHTGGAPPKKGWQVDLGLRDQAVVEMAARRGAYTLWGLVPFLRLQQQRNLGMEALVIGDPMLQRVMVSVVVNRDRIPGSDEEGALAFERFLLEPSTQARIRQFRHHGLKDQSWWPAGRNNAGSDLMQF